MAWTCVFRKREGDKEIQSRRVCRPNLYLYLITCHSFATRAFTTCSYSFVSDASTSLSSSESLGHSGQPFACNQCSTSRCPPCAATWLVYSSHGQPFARAHCSTSSCPPLAAYAHVKLFHGQPFARAHCINSRCPPYAAYAHVSESHGQPFARAHCSISSRPILAADAHVPSSHGQPFARNH